MKYKHTDTTVEAYQLTKDYATDAPKWVRDRIGTRLFENSTIRDGSLRFDGLTLIIQNHKLRERMTARPGDYLVRLPDGNVLAYTKRNFEQLYTASGEQTSMYDNPPAGGPKQTTMDADHQIGQGTGALIDINTFRPDDTDDE